ncbi:MAG: glycosyltransferase family 4 protein [Terriglobales bacterium]
MPFQSSARETGTEVSQHPLRVAIVAPRIQHLIGGQEVQADLLLRLWRNDPEVRVSYLASNPELPPWLESVRYVRTMVRFPRYLAHLIAGLRDADVVHVFSTSFSGFVISVVPAYCVGRFLGKKVLINYRSGLARNHLSASALARSILRSADKVVVPSSYLVGAFHEFQIAAEAIPNVVDTGIFSYRSRSPLRPLLLCSRNLEECYGIDLVVRAFAEVQKAFPEARLFLLGEGSRENAIRRLIADPNVKGVEMPGRIPREHIAEFYNKADILINASRVDNMPVSVLEAFASGLPVVSSNAGGIPTIVRHEETGLLSDTEDWKGLAANVIRLLEDPALAKRLTENAYRQSLTYHWENVRDQWVRSYQELARQ